MNQGDRQTSNRPILQFDQFPENDFMPDSGSSHLPKTPCFATQLWFSCPRSAYLVGICGSGMKALAEVLLDRDWLVAGSDLQGDGAVGEILRLKGARVFASHSAAQIPAGVDILIFSSAVKPETPERAWAAAHEVPQFAYHELLGELMESKIGISISGTHGKSTTTALTGCILTSAGLSPTVVVGAEVLGRQANGWSGSGPHLVAESCEYRRHFLSLRPQLATILGIEADHFDCFAGTDETAKAFQEFAALIPATGILVIHRECSASQFAAQSAVCAIETISMNHTPQPYYDAEMTESRGDEVTCLGLVANSASLDLLTPSSLAKVIGMIDGNALASGSNSTHISDPEEVSGKISPATGPNPEPATWTAENIEKTEHGYRFHILHRGAKFCSAHLNIPGRHHVLNVLAATALCFRAGATPEQISAGIAEFRGIRRRFEVLGDWRGVTIVDDYAHHPTAIRATLRTAKEQYLGRRIVCVFQPHQVSRTLGLLDQFAHSFSDAAEVLIVPVYGARENFERELSEVSLGLAELIAAEGVPARFCSRLDQTWTSLEDTLRPGDVLITLGAGDIDRIHSTLHGLR
ncbi:MAG: UDP-N-acetylmuramate--L-alanine ligase [Planctomycetaceae bacterium]|nr:UDP-N-acetylmuramate--L-alanine ligase [Planctomycetaceae bacterium]